MPCLLQYSDEVIVVGTLAAIRAHRRMNMGSTRDAKAYHLKQSTYSYIPKASKNVSLLFVLNDFSCRLLSLFDILRDTSEDR